jgi:hypothetical protein
MPRPWYFQQQQATRACLQVNSLTSLRRAFQSPPSGQCTDGDDCGGGWVGAYRAAVPFYGGEFAFGIACKDARRDVSLPFPLEQGPGVDFQGR